MSEPHLARGIDAALVARAKQGDRVAFEVLVVKYQRRVAASPEEEATAHQPFEPIDARVAALPKVQRRALLMREIDGLD